MRILGGSGAANDHCLTSIEGQPLSSIRGGTDLNIAHTGCDIQQHLQSMFYLLRREETLKMVCDAFKHVTYGILTNVHLSLQAVKLETARNGRTRYLAVVSRPAPCRHTQSAPTPSPPQLVSVQTGRSERSQTNTPTAQHKRSHSSSATTAKRPANKCTSLDGGHHHDADAKCDRSTRSSLDEEHACDATSHFCNESDESCLLGIDCNDRTTVGLVLRIQADTTIRLDGDG